MSEPHRYWERSSQQVEQWAWGQEVAWLGLLQDNAVVWDWAHPGLYLCFSGIRDVSKWSEKARKPLEGLYGYDYFAKTCENWVDSISQFKELPDGKLHGLMVALLTAGEAWVPLLISQHFSIINIHGHYPHMSTETQVTVYNISSRVVSVSARQDHWIKVIDKALVAVCSFPFSPLHMWQHETALQKPVSAF